MVKPIKRVIAPVLGAVLLCAGTGAASAATVSLSGGTASVGGTIDLTLQGNFEVPTIGGSERYSWDPTLFAGPPTVTFLAPWGILGPVDNSVPDSQAFTVAVGLADPPAIGVFDILRLTFQVLATATNGPTEVLVAQGAEAWGDALGVPLPEGTVTFNGASVTVVPLPAAVWLLGAGLMGWVSSARPWRRAA
jgi:hypothetical protein